MGKIRGDGSDIVMVNGRQVLFQGLGHLKKDVATSAAVEKTAADGYKKYFLASIDRNERLLVYGDRLDFGFLARQKVPQISVNGKVYLMVAHDDQDATWTEGFSTGAKTGLAQASGATVDAAKQIITNVGSAGLVFGGVMAGGVVVAVMKGFTVDQLIKVVPQLGSFVSASARNMAIPAIGIVLTVLGIGTVVAGLAGGIKGAAELGARKHDTKAIASVIDANIEGDNPDPGGHNPAPLPLAPKPENGPKGPQPWTPPGSGSPGETPLQPLPGNQERRLGAGSPKNLTARRLGAALRAFHD